jgi:hypothetical protein
MSRTRCSIIACAFLAGACSSGPAARPDTAAHRVVAAPRPTWLDSAAARRLCENADSAARGLAGCRLRNQRLY